MLPLNWLPLLILLPGFLNAALTKNASVSWNPVTKAFFIHDYKVDRWVAWAVFTDEITTTGWSYLEVFTNENFPDSVQVYAAGLVEGHLTSDLIKKSWYNQVEDYCDGEAAYCKRLKGFLTTNLNFMNDNIKKYRNVTPYWHQVSLILEQLSGLQDGFANSPQQPSTQVDVMGLMLMNICGDLEEIEVVLNKTVTRKLFGSGSCSALIKVLPGNKDLYAAHDTWTIYSTMVRILKKYNIPVHLEFKPGSPVIPGHAAAFSSQPGMLFSGDDFYLLSSGLVTIETTIGNSNASLWKFVTPNNTVLEWVRNLVANRLSSSGKEWCTYFKMFNSGTYNNQWMIVDYKKFQTRKPLQNGLLWVLEQLPGYVHFSDVTDVLRNQGYWPSYNTPYYEDIFNKSGGVDKVNKYGDWFSYKKTPRALIFKRDQVKVHDIPSMMKLMRYNDFQNDPLSRCNCTPPYSAENAISARCDLNPINGTYPFDSLGHRPHGATDMKLTTSTLFKRLQFVAIGGPTHDPLPPFQWSKSDFDKTLRHVGQPDLWKFDPVVHKWL